MVRLSAVVEREAVARQPARQPAGPPAGPPPAAKSGARDKCGVFAVFGHPDAVRLTYCGLFALQHRGQESAGIAAADGSALEVRRGMGLVAEALQEADLAALEAPGRRSAVGHVRYSTTGPSRLQNAQPLLLRSRLGPVALAHNGNLTNAEQLRRACEAGGSIFQTESDTEVIPHLMARSAATDLPDAFTTALTEVRGAYALALLAPGQLLLARDPHGIRPLTLGRLDGALVAASETCALEAVGAERWRDMAPGEILAADGDGVHPIRLAPAAHESLCLFEYIYLARPDSDVRERNVHLVRREMGRHLARIAPVAADVVVGVPDSGVSAATGYAEESGVPYQLGLVKNRYVGRTFIQPTQAVREAGVRLKLNAVKSVLGGQRVVLVDDSIVRGTTSRRLVALLRDAGAREVHLRIASPPFVSPCFYGVDVPSAGELLAADRSLDEMTAYTGADSLAFLPEAEAVTAAGAGGFCTACFSGRYPVPVLRSGDRGRSVARAGAAGEGRP